MAILMVPSKTPKCQNWGLKLNHKISHVCAKSARSALSSNISVQGDPILVTKVPLESWDDADLNDAKQPLERSFFGVKAQSEDNQLTKKYLWGLPPSLKRKSALVAFAISGGKLGSKFSQPLPQSLKSCVDVAFCQDSFWNSLFQNLCWYSTFAS